MLPDGVRQRLILAERLARGVNRHPRRWLAVCALWLAVQVSPWWYATSDGCMYLSLARNIAAGGPLECLGRPVCVPPGYPLLISPAFLFGDRPFLLLAVLNWLFAIALLAGVYRWARRLMPQAAVWVTGLTAVNAGVCYYYRRTLKEIAFMAAVVWAVHALHALEHARDRRRRPWLAVLAAALVVLVISIRYTGIVLVAGFAAVAVARWIRRQRTAGQGSEVGEDTAEVAGARPVGPAVVALGGLAVLVLWLLVSQVGTTYLTGFAETLRDPLMQSVEGVRMRFGNLVRLMVPGMLKAYGSPRDWLDWNIALGVCLAGVVAWGWLRLVRERDDVWAWALPFYVAIYVLWPPHQGGRFMVPMIPVLIACFWFGLARLRRVRTAVFAACFAAHLGGTFGYWAFVDAPRAAAEHAWWETADRLAAAFDPDAGEGIASWRLPNTLEAMLMLSLDRHAVPIRPGQPVKRSVQWIVQSAEYEVREGFLVTGDLDGYQILVRAAGGPQAPGDAVVAPEPAENDVRPQPPLRSAAGERPRAVQ